MKKVICDICNKEIDINAGMSAYESIKVDKASVFGRKAKPEVIKISLDICAECGVDVEKCFKELKKGGEENDD